MLKIESEQEEDGRWIASGGEDSTVKIWDSQTGAIVHSYRGHTALVSSLVFSPDGRRLFSGSRDKTVKLWDSATNTVLARIMDARADSNSFAQRSSSVTNRAAADRLMRSWANELRKRLDIVTGQGKTP